MQITTYAPSFNYTSITENTFEAEWTNQDGETLDVALFSSELVQMMHEHLDLGHDLLGVYYTTLGSYYVRIEQAGIIKSVPLSTYTRHNALRKQKQLIPILEKEYNDMAQKTIEDILVI